MGGADGRCRSRCQFSSCLCPPADGSLSGGRGGGRIHRHRHKPDGCDVYVSVVHEQDQARAVQYGLYGTRLMYGNANFVDCTCSRHLGDTPMSGVSIWGRYTEASCNPESVWASTSSSRTKTPMTAATPGSSGVALHESTPRQSAWAM